MNGESTEISGLEVIGDYTLQVTLNEACSYFLYKLTCPAAFVVNEENVETGDDWWYSPDGTGPFKLKQWSQGSLLVLERYDLYDPLSSFVSVGTVNYHLWRVMPWTYMRRER